MVTSHLFLDLAAMIVFGFSVLLPVHSLLLDLSLTLENRTVGFPGEYYFFIRQSMSRSNRWFRMEDFSTNTHAGTHLDAPCYYSPSSKAKLCVPDIPLEKLFNVPAVVVDITKGSEDLKVEDLLDWTRWNGDIPRGSVVLVRTGWYRGQPWQQARGVSPEAAEWLFQNSQVLGVGIDSPSIDGARQNAVTHRVLSDSNIYILENLAQLENLPPKDILLFVFPIKIKNAGAAPARVMALISNSAPSFHPPSAVSLIVLPLLFALFSPIWS